MELLARFRRWLLLGIALAALMYLVFSLWAGLPQVASVLARFHWWYAVPVLGLTVVNYALRFAKWHWLMRKLQVPIKPADDLRIFLAGMAMTITPGKAGELLKPYLTRTVTGTPVSRTVPALIAERGTDAIAMLLLASLGVTTYFAEGVGALVMVGVLFAAGLTVLASRRLSLAAIALVGKLPVIGKLEPKLHDMYEAARTCFQPGTLLFTTAIAAAAWLAECVGFYVIFLGFDLSPSLDATVFLYAFSTIAGAPSPGGLGVADTALAQGALRLVPNITPPEAIAAALLCRIATLWFGVLVGGLVLIGQASRLTGSDAPAGLPRENGGTA